MATPSRRVTKFCLCCKNPWNQQSFHNTSQVAGGGGGGSGNEEEELKDDTSSASSDSYVYRCEPCTVNASESKNNYGIDPANFDDSVSLKENFFLWSNGSWKKNNPIPKEYPSWNTFTALHDMNLSRIRDLLNELQAPGAILSEEGQKLADVYNSFMDETEIDALGMLPLEEVLSMIQKSSMPVDELVGTLHAHYGVSALFSVYATSDKKNSSHSIGAISQGSLGLPDRDYYFEEDKKEKCTKYVKYITDLFILLGQSNLSTSSTSSFDCSEYSTAEKCAAIANEIFELEKTLASSFLTRTESRDPEKTYNKMSLLSLQSRTNPQLLWSEYLTKGVTLDANTFSWNRYFSKIGKPEEALGEINVSNPKSAVMFTSICRDTSKRGILKNYFIFRAINSFALSLPTAFADLYFNFFQKELSGAQEKKPRWKQALAYLESTVGDSLGKMYVNKFFPEGMKAKALDIVERVRAALQERLENVEWMTAASTRQEALKKMNKFRVKIGYPDKWISYDDLVIRRGAHIANLFEGHRHEFKLDLKRMNAPVDREKWFMTPQTVNAYYHPSLNEIVFPAAILQPPFFDVNADIAVQFGSMGAVVGHEMTHGFDDQGRKYDSEGNLRDWWTESDAKEYERRADVMIKHAEKFEVYGLKLKGKLTCGENIADLGGVKLSLLALKKYMQENEGARQNVNGFTPVQRLFLAWSQCWRENVTEERAKMLVTLDPHGPNELRCNGTLSCVPEFAEEFGLLVGDKMYLPAEERVDIW